MQLAGAIPGAAFVPLESRNHILLEAEPAWRMFSDVTREFLKDAEFVRPKRPAQA